MRYVIAVIAIALLVSKLMGAAENEEEIMQEEIRKANEVLKISTGEIQTASIVTAIDPQ